MKVNSCHMFQSAITMLAAAIFASCGHSEQTTDAYSFKMILYVPRVYANTSSKGYRKYQRQSITGRMYVTYDTSPYTRPAISFGRLVNMTHKVNGTNVVYDVTNDEFVMPRVNVIGNNQTGVFRTPSVEFAIHALPSYSIGPAPDEDNSLNIALSGKGSLAKDGSATVIRFLSGYVAGTLGCSCSEYGHVSPTRVMGMFGPSEYVDDVAAVFGRWKATRVSAESRR